VHALGKRQGPEPEGCGTGEDLAGRLGPVDEQADQALRFAIGQDRRGAVAGDVIVI